MWTENIPAITPYKTDKSNLLNVINSDIFLQQIYPDDETHDWIKMIGSFS